MSSKNLSRIKKVLMALLLVLAELLQSAVFGGLQLGMVPAVMPVAVACIAMYEGPENGAIYGLIGGCLWAWSSELSYYGAWCILVLTGIGFAAGLVTERYLLRGIKTLLTFSAGAVVLTDGLHTLAGIFSGRVPPTALFSVFLPGALISLILSLGFLALASYISKIGGTHG